jgi:F-type H+-transporting ATPase subunit epsilon
MDQLTCIVVTPERTALDQACDFVVVPLYDGELGVALNHAPMIGRLGYGELRLKSQGQTSRYYLDGGFVQVSDNVITVLTEQAVPAELIDVAQAEEQLRAASHRRAPTQEEREERDRQVAQARAKVRVGQRAASE